MMTGRGVLFILICFILGFALCVTGWGAEFRSVGLRMVIPLGGMPFMLGIEASTDLPFGVGSCSFFLSGDGKTLITLSGDVRLTSGTATGETFLRLTTGLFYFDSSRILPSLVLGGGVSYEIPLGAFVAFSLAGEFLYPLAFPLPMLGLSGRWVFE